VTLEPDPNDPFEPAFPRYYDREGKRISLAEWARLFEDREGYGRIAEEDVLTPNGELAWVSTVWLGLDHNYFGSGPPLIFESMVFEQGMDDRYMDRYPTEQAAREGHAFIVHALQEGMLYDRSENEVDP